MAPQYVAYHLVAAAGAEDDEVIFTIPSGRLFRVLKLKIDFPTGTYGELQIYLKRGAERVFPHSGSVMGEDRLLEFDVDILYQSEEQIVVHYKNTNTTSSKECFIYIGGEMA